MTMSFTTALNWSFTKWIIRVEWITRKSDAC
jgi:hypothetical protein